MPSSIFTEDFNSCKQLKKLLLVILRNILYNYAFKNNFKFDF